MKNIFAFAITGTARNIIVVAMFFTSCSSGNDKKETVSIPNPPVMNNPKSIQTDSGRIEITDEGKATLIASDGTVRGRGYFYRGEPAGAWVRYDEKGTILSAAHLSHGKPIRVLDKDDFDFTTYKNEKLGAQFSVPRGWKEVKSPNQAQVVSFEKEVKDSSIAVKPNFNVARAKLQKGDSLPGLALSQIQLLHETVDGVEVVNEAYINIDGCQAFRRYGKYNSGVNKVGFLNLIIVSGSDAWFFSFDAQNKSEGEFLLYQGVFQEITESFRRTQ